MAFTRVVGPGIHTQSNIDSHNIHSTGIITAVSFVGSGAALTGIDATAIKDSDGNVKVQAQASGAMYTGIHTFTGNVTIGGTLTYEDVKNIDSVGIITAPALDVDDFLDVGSNIKLGNAGVITATSFVGSGAALTGIDATAIKDSGGNVKTVSYTHLTLPTILRV